MSLIALVDPRPYFVGRLQWVEIEHYAPSQSSYPVRVRFPDGRTGHYKLYELVMVRWDNWQLRSAPRERGH